MRKSLRLAPAVVLLLAACAAAPGAPAVKTRQTAADAVAQLVDNYNTPRGESFVRLLDSNRFPNSDQFGENIRFFQIHSRQINLDLVVDGADHGAASADVDVRAHWNKTYVDSKGARQTSSGSCELLLSRQSSGRLLLAAIHGQSPF